MVYCPNCRNKVTANSNFCNYCGKEIPAVINESIPAFPYNESYGFWKVTTEGDVEGRTMKDLGVHEGHIDEIAQALSPACYYSLHFEAAPDPKKFGNEREPRDEVSININSSDLWRLSGDERLAVISELLKDRPVKVKDGKYYKSVTLVFEKKS